MNRTDSRDCQHRDDRLGNLGHVESHAVALPHTEGQECVGGLLDRNGQSFVGVNLLVARLTLKIERDSRTVSGEHVSVEAVVCDV